MKQAKRRSVFFDRERQDTVIGRAFPLWHRRRWAELGAISALLAVACSSGEADDGPEEEHSATGGASSASGGSAVASGGTAQATGGVGTESGGSGGSEDSASGGATSPGAGGTATETGGTTSSSGGDGGDDEIPKSSGCGKEPSLKSGDVQVQSQGSLRNYKLQIVDEYDSAHPYRLILSFHGATGSSADVAPGYFGLRALAEGSTIFVAPDAVGGLWNGSVDVDFVDAIIEQVEADLCIDLSRVELEGFSQGGAMVWTVACARPGVFRAAVVHSGGGLSRPASCAPIAFMSSLGASESGGARQTSNSDFFAEQNGCTVEPLAQAPSGGHACSDYSGCSENHPTRWCDYDGGHTPEPRDQGQNTSWMPEEVWSFLTQF